MGGTKASETTINGMLRHAFSQLAGRNILWHIVAPRPALIFYFHLMAAVWCYCPRAGMRRSRGLALGQLHQAAALKV